MSKQVNDCDIVLELLPLYLDGKTCEESNAFVKEHLEGCSECSEVHRFMSADFSREKLMVSEETGKSRRRRWKKLAILMGGLLAYLLLMMGIVVFAIWLLVYR